MEDLIRSLINFALSPVRTIVKEVTDRLLALASTLTGAMGRARAAFVYWTGRGQTWFSAAANNAWQTVHTVRWLITVVIPDIVREGAEAARRYAADLVAAATAVARAGLTQLQAWTAQRLTDALRALTSLQSWVTGQLAGVALDIRRIKDHVFGPLATPDRLALWLVGAMFNALLAFVWVHAAALAEIAWRHRKIVPDRTLDLVDDITERIF